MSVVFVYKFRDLLKSEKILKGKYIVLNMSVAYVKTC